MALFIEKPGNFTADFEAAGWYARHDNRLLYLKKTAGHRFYPQAWGVPAGRLHVGETALAGIMRETREETGLAISADSLIYLQTVYCQHPAGAFPYHVFYTRFAEKPIIKIDPTEHETYEWLELSEIMKRELVLDEPACLNFFKPLLLS